MDGFITFLSFIFFGFFPLLGYCVFPFIFPDMSQHELFLVACLSSGVTLFVLGAVKSMFSVQTWWRSGVEMTAIGYFVCFVAYSIGAMTRSFFGVDPSL